MSYMNNNMINNTGRGIFPTLNQYQMYNTQNRIMPMQNYNLPHYDSPLLHGKSDADNFLMGPNSSIFLPDADENIIWWIQTDTAGTKTVMPMKIIPPEKSVPIDIKALEARLTAVEEWMNAKSNKSNAAKRNGSNANNNAATTIATTTNATTTIAE